MFGDAGDDTLQGDLGNDSAIGGDGNDTFLAALTSADGYDFYDGGNNIDTLDYSAATSAITVSMTAQNRSTQATTGADGSGPNLDTVGAILTTANATTPGQGLTSTTSVGKADGVGIGTDAFRNIENVTTGSGADKIVGDAANNTIRAGGNADQVWGQGGNDTIYGDDGDDILIGGFGGNATGSGNDTLYGGIGVDQLFGEDGNDTLWGGAGADQYAGYKGNDTLYFEGDGVSDAAWGGQNRDTFIFQAGFGVDSLKDFIAVGSESDKLNVSAIVSSFSVLTISQVGNNTEIIGLGAGNKIILEYVLASSVGADDFVWA
jgi:Ca2+-binding RTX toxin-like protein